MIRTMSVRRDQNWEYACKKAAGIVTLLFSCF